MAHGASFGSLEQRSDCSLIVFRGNGTKTAMLAIEERKKIKSSNPRTILEAKHLAGTLVLPTREDLLDRMPAGAVVAEIGVAYGDFTTEILTRAKPRKLHLIDMWAGDRYGPGGQNVADKFRAAIEDGTITINQGRSVEVLRDMPDQYFDWVYIDTDHSYHLTARELKFCLTKVKPDGRILGHDFTSGNVITPVPYGVIEACHEFCKNFDWRYEYLTLEPHGHFSFCLKRIE